jgi:hypothetical protein
MHNIADCLVFVLKRPRPVLNLLLLPLFLVLVVHRFVKMIQQHQNLSMLMQTISMRANPVNIKSPTVETINIDNKFGTVHKGKHQVWTFKFDIEYDGAYTDVNGDDAGLLLDDLNFIPVTINLDETANISPAIFNTRHDEDCNTIISVVSG